MASSVASEADIANYALSLIGERVIQSFDGTSEESRKASLLYGKVRDETLRLHNWNFAVQFANLSQLSTPPGHLYSFSYQLPSDFLRVVDVNWTAREIPKIKWERIGSAIYTDFESESSTLPIRYIRRVTDPVEFDPLFIEVLAYRLAAVLIPSVSGDNNRSTQLADHVERTLLPRARRIDAQEGNPAWPVNDLANDDLVRARTGFDGVG